MTPGPRPTVSAWRRSAVTLLLPLAVYFGSALLLQVARHAYTAELDGADEPAHFVTSLLIHDYLRQGLPWPPMAFAENYYVHYPKVGIPMWPPVFHLTTAVWMLAFPATIASARVLVALITAVAALLAYQLTRADVGRGTALAIGGAFVALPQTQAVTQQVMADGLVAALVLGAALAWQRYGRTLRARDSLWFGLLGTAAMLTKGNGVALLALPVAWALIANRMDVLWRRATWLGPALMLLAGGPWQIYSLRMLQRAVVNAEARGTLLTRAAAYSTDLVEGVGPVVLAAAAAGLVAVLARRLRGAPVPETWAVLTALTVAVLGFHIVLPQPPAWRYLLPLLPSCLWLAIRGRDALCDLVPSSLRTVAATVVSAALLVNVADLAARVERRQHHGVGAIAEWVLGRPNGVVIVSDDGATGTAGMFISELAVRERRPGHIILRAHKTLSTATWDGFEQRLVYDTPAAVADYLRRIPVRYVVVDDVPAGERPDPVNALLRAAMEEHRTTWALAATFPDAANPSRRRLVYEWPAATSTTGSISIDMRHTLGRSITRPAPD